MRAWYQTGKRFEWAGLDPVRLRARAGLPQAFPTLLARAQTGDTVAIALVASAYLDGDGVATDTAEGLRWARKGFDLGDPVSAYLLAEQRLAERPNDPEGLAWLTAAGDQNGDFGYGPADWQLSRRYMTGDGVERSEDKALRYQGAAMRVRYPQAQYAGMRLTLDDSWAYEPGRTALDDTQSAAQGGLPEAIAALPALAAQAAITEDIDKLAVARIDGLRPLNLGDSRFVSVCLTQFRGSWGRAMVDWREVTIVTPKGLDLVVLETRNPTSKFDRRRVDPLPYQPKGWVVRDGLPPFKPHLLILRTPPKDREPREAGRARLARVAAGLKQLQAACADWSPGPLDLIELPRPQVMY